MTAPTAPRSSSLLLVAAAVLAALLVGAGAYIAQLRTQLGAQTAQLQPFLAAAQTLYPDADPVTALRSIGKRLGELRPPGPARAPVALVPAPVQLDELLTAAQQDAMLAVLRDEPDSGRKAWFLVAQNSAESLGVQAALQGLFEKAGWPVETQRAPYPLKAGVFMLAGDETPPAFVDRVNEAFSAAELDVQYLTGYRAFYAERKAVNPGWVGPALADGQPFTIVIGSRPKMKEAAAN